jgi:hypothetical protein
VHPSRVADAPHRAVRGLRDRLQWIRTHVPRLGWGDVAQAESAVVAGLVDDLWTEYRRGNLERFHAARAQLLAGWPEDVAVPTALVQRVAPAWIIRTRRLAGRVLGMNA